MSIPSFIPSRRRRRRKKQAAAGAGVLTLVEASYVDGVSLTLVFNQPIDVSAFDGAAVMVNDAEFTQTVWIATGAVTLLDAMTMRVGLDAFESTGGGGVLLTAPATTGIVGVNDGAPWAGVTDLELPFG